ncbi:unnamed protein product [Rotaria socialis]|uniref:Uncharacterized protein n=1 Tax=Rotaria socialis TaxID=392032 RepID=A0A820RLV7_9BILA|nr:unnamed protein product [Rotaria socialis]CAF3353368.1 unnamed protein product [Rotaria socialis]CAF3372381.1 unnamed protein product [Rotaria socialis]CAF3459980.1 unnamed protein product [Rotaria socialis]CAF3719577.1 unnamed protein product [Rotaria socialis]
MAFTNLFRRHSCLVETPAANYACMDENSTAETLLDELETECRNCSISLASKTKRNSEVLELSGGYLASTYASSSSARRSSVDYSWLSPQNNVLQIQTEPYHLPDILKMELGELIRNVQPEDCTFVVNQFRRQVRSLTKHQTPESIIALFRKTLADYIDQKQKHRSSSNEISKINEGNNLPSLAHTSSIRNNRVLPKKTSEDEQHSIAELTEISLTSSHNDSNVTKPRSRTYT